MIDVQHLSFVRLHAWPAKLRVARAEGTLSRCRQQDVLVLRVIGSAVTQLTYDPTFHQHEGGVEAEVKVD